MRSPFVPFLLLALICYGGMSIPTLAQKPGVWDERPIPTFILDSVHIITADVFDSTNRLPLIGGIAEHLHARTRERAISNELFFKDGDTLSQIDLDELELNLRRLTIFSDIRLEVVPWKGEEEEKVPYAMLVIRTRDAWSLRVSGSYSRSGDYISLFGGLREVNLFGLAKQLGVNASYTDFNNLGWRLGATYFNPNIFGTHIHIGADAGFAKNQRSGNFTVGRSFFSDRTKYGFNTAVAYYDGEEVFDVRGDDGDPLALISDTRRTAFGGWYSRAQGRSGDIFRTSVSLTYNNTIREGVPGIHRALDNSVGVFGGISSHRRRYTKFLNADFEGERQIAVGGAGSITIGKIAPHSGGLDNIVYVGGDARQGLRFGDFYGFASIEAGTGLAGKEARFTTERVTASAAYLLGAGALAARFEQSTVWNWPHYLFVAVDNNNGLRGYTRLQTFGDNRMFFNFEYRAVPIVQVWTFDVGATAFYDVGSAWRQSEQISNVRFHSSAGLGLRFSNAKAKIERGLLRVDLAYNFDQKKFARLIISSEESFDVFGTLDYRPPAPYLY